MVTYSRDLNPDQIQDIYKQQNKSVNDIYYRAELAEKLDHLARVIDVKLCEKWIEEGMKFCEENQMTSKAMGQNFIDSMEGAFENWKPRQRYFMEKI